MHNRVLGIFVALMLCLTCSQTLGQALVRTIDDPTVSSLDLFGFALSVDGGRVLVGATGHDSPTNNNVGQAHLFDWQTGNVLQTFDVPGSGNPSDGFGDAVSLSGSFALIGAYNFTSNTTTQNGGAFLFNTDTGNLLHTFQTPGGVSFAGFGASVSVAGNQAVVGADQFDPGGGNNDIGRAFVFNGNSGALVHTFDDPTPTNDDFFGQALDTSGNLAVVASRGDDTLGTNFGQAYIFDLNSGNHLITIDDPALSSSNDFARDVAISGNHVLVGAPGSDNAGVEGKAYLFDATTGQLITTFDDPTSNSGDFFGKDVEIHGNFVLISSPRDDSNSSFNGEAYLFDLAGNLLHTFIDPTPSSGDWFSESISMTDGIVAIGAPFDNSQGTFAGQAHIYTVPEPNQFALLIVVGLLLKRRKRS